MAIFLSVYVDTKLALENEILIANLCYHMLSGTSVAEAIFVVRETASLTKD